MCPNLGSGLLRSTAFLPCSQTEMGRSKRARGVEVVVETAGGPPTVPAGSDPAVALPPAWIEGPGPHEGRLAWAEIIPVLSALAIAPGIREMVHKVGRMPRPPADVAGGRQALVWDGVHALESLLEVVRRPPTPRPNGVNYLIPCLAEISSGDATDGFR